VICSAAGCHQHQSCSLSMGSRAGTPAHVRHAGMKPACSVSIRNQRKKSKPSDMPQRLRRCAYSRQWTMWLRTHDAYQYRVKREVQTHLRVLSGKGNVFD